MACKSSQPLPCQVTGRAGRNGLAGWRDAPFPLSPPAGTRLGLLQQAAVKDEAGNSHFSEYARERVRTLRGAE